MSKLAINGGTPVRTTMFPAQNTIGVDEKQAAMRVLDSGILTGYQGNWGPNFRGGREVRALEEEWATKFGVRHAIACHSATAGLFIACGAAGMGHTMGDIDGRWRGGGDAIVTPFSMTCSATAPMGWGAGVQFGDIERDYYCLDAQRIYDELRHTFKKFSAIIPVSLFGQPYDAEIINLFAREKGMVVIEDAAQAVGATLLIDGKKKYAGTLGDIGVFSFNLGKHLTCGEGGMIVTDNDELAMRCRLIMNHAEAVVNDMARHTGDQGGIGDVMVKKYEAMFGFNLRLTEINAAIMREQLRKMDDLVGRRVDNVAYLVDKLRGIPCLEMPKVRPGAMHTYYVLPLKYKSWANSLDNLRPGHHRDKFVAAVKAELKPCLGRETEGVTIGCGYIKPIQSMPLFGRSVDETPECRRQYEDELIIVHRMFGPLASRRDLDDVAAAFAKVWENREELL